VPAPLVPLFDFDGTLVDSDAALIAPFLDLGLAPEELPPLGLPLTEACERVGIAPADYVARYDPMAAQPFPGVAAVVGALDVWGVASNKERSSGRQELARLGWNPTTALFSDDFGGAEKSLGPLLDRLALHPSGALFVGDTGHDRACAATAGVRFAVAGWNPRARADAHAGDLVLDHPAQVLDLLAA
jgi:phosphoglycolate phosphatase-like HAD superfamily hydrolase